MKTILTNLAALLIVFAASVAAQIPTVTGVQILKAEDSRRYDAVLENLLKSPNEAIRLRAALAAGRIGDEKAVPTLAELLENDQSVEVRTMAAFALGEIESAKASTVILGALSVKDLPTQVRARAVEAAGKIAAANARDESSKALRNAVLNVLKAQSPDNIGADEQTTLLALTAVLRSRPDGAEPMVAKFLNVSNSRIVADAANTLARLSAKNSNEPLRRALKADPDGAARANAARALGAAGDKDSYDQLVEAMNDRDLRVRVSAIRALAALREQKAVEKLIEQGRAYLKSFDDAPREAAGRRGAAKRQRLPAVINELLEISAALARLLPNTEHTRAVVFVNELRFNTDRLYAETETALARIAPKAYVAAVTPPNFGYQSPRQASAFAQGLGDIAQTKNAELIAEAGEKLTTWVSGMPCRRATLGREADADGHAGHNVSDGSLEARQSQRHPARTAQKRRCFHSCRGRRCDRRSAQNGNQYRVAQKCLSSCTAYRHARQRRQARHSGSNR